MHFQHSETRNVVAQHDLVGTRGLVHALYDLKVAVSEVEEVFIDGHTPGVRQPRHYGDTVTPIWITALNLWRFNARQEVTCGICIPYNRQTAFYIVYITG